MKKNSHNPKEVKGLSCLHGALFGINVQTLRTISLGRTDISKSSTRKLEMGNGGETKI
jgi:hypothetical protein